jgi:UDP-N-acetylmuramyl pentapeptide phosphotransferase/UDP-N-acetylglucosamine-1-phosphate transferase
MNYIFIFLLLFAAELAYFKLANHFNIIDKPNERSSHTRITLRGGGIIFYIGVLLYFASEGYPYPWFFAGLTLIAGISFADDIRPQSSKIRLVVHFLAMALMFYQWNLFSLSWYFTIFALIFCTGILNAYNFMDGINGITGGYSMVVAGALLYVNQYQVSFVDSEFIYILLLALLVFNFFNFRPKARCFAGDVGAISIAFILVFLLGLLIVRTGDFSYLVLLSVYGVDTVLTIIHRLILKENILQPHRKHAYQLMANELKIPQVVVSLIYVLLQAVVIVGLFVFKLHSYYYLFVVIILLSLVYFLFKKKNFHLHRL